MPINYKDYPPNWLTEIVPAIRERSRNECEFCYLKNSSIVFSITTKSAGRLWLASREDFDYFLSDKRHDYVNGSWKETKVVLTVAHLDHDVDNWEVSINRLRHLCQLCHINYDKYSKLKEYQKWIGKRFINED